MSNIPRTTARHSAKLRSAPAHGTASSVYLRMHQLANEQERLEKELINLSDRTQEVVKLIAELQNELGGLSGEASRQLVKSEVRSITITPRSLFKIQSASGKKFDGMSIDY
jgi:HPt (histidine-containing phosphotransfer) domain-containing protein